MVSVIVVKRFSLSFDKIISVLQHNCDMCKGHFVCSLKSPNLDIHPKAAKNRTLTSLTKFIRIEGNMATYIFCPLSP